MEKNDEITISEAKKITGELKASILKLETLNSGVLMNIKQLENLNQKLENYSSILRKFEPKNEEEMVQSYSHYLSFLAQKIEDLNKNKDLKKQAENLINNLFIRFSIFLDFLSLIIVVLMITTNLAIVV